MKCNFLYIQLEYKAENSRPQFKYARHYEEKGKLDIY